MLSVVKSQVARHGLVFLDRGILMALIVLVAFGGTILGGHGGLQNIKYLEAYMWCVQRFRVCVARFAGDAGGPLPSRHT